MSVCPFKERNVCCRCGEDDHLSNRCPQPWALPSCKPVGFTGPLQPSLIDLNVEHGPPQFRETVSAADPPINVETASTAEQTVETVNTAELYVNEPTETTDSPPSDGSWAEEASNFTASLNGDETSMELSGDGIQLTTDLPDALPQSASSPKIISYVPSPVETSTVQQSPSSHQQLLIAYSPSPGDAQPFLHPSLTPLPANRVAMQPPTTSSSEMGTVVPPTEGLPQRKTKLSYAGATVAHVKRPKAKKSDSALHINLLKLKKASTARAKALATRGSTVDPPEPTS
jgi:hypothetical protein